MKPTVALLIACGISPTQARAFEQPFADACTRFQINTPPRLAAFIGQCMVESGGFIHTEENLFYSNPERVRQIFPRSVPSLADAATLVRKPQALASRVYANRNGNGNEASGDGWRFRGRGLIQLTGRDNYRNASIGLAAPEILDQPDTVAQPIEACMTAAWYWHSNKLNSLADAGNTDAITRAVNGAGMADATLRRQYTDAAMRAIARAA